VRDIELPGRADLAAAHLKYVNGGFVPSPGEPAASWSSRADRDRARPLVDIFDGADEVPKRAPPRISLSGRGLHLAAQGGHELRVRPSRNSRAFSASARYSSSEIRPTHGAEHSPRS
jgi:hypothetical protein